MQEDKVVSYRKTSKGWEVLPNNDALDIQRMAKLGQVKEDAKVMDFRGLSYSFGWREEGLRMSIGDCAVFYNDDRGKKDAQNFYNACNRIGLRIQRFENELVISYTRWQ
jgi:hypothetical protein